MRSPRTATKSSLRSAQLQKAHVQQQGPNAAKKKKKRKKENTQRIQLSVVSTQHTCVTCFAEAISPPQICPLLSQLTCRWVPRPFLLGVCSLKPHLTGHSTSPRSSSCGTCASLSLSVSSTLVFPARPQVTGGQNLRFSFLAPPFTRRRAFCEAEWALAK